MQEEVAFFEPGSNRGKCPKVFQLDEDIFLDGGGKKLFPCEMLIVFLHDPLGGLGMVEPGRY